MGTDGGAAAKNNPEGVPQKGTKSHLGLRQ
jgi:hypothetical protein